jgi:hypothetical protein
VDSELRGVPLACVISSRAKIECNKGASDKWNHELCGWWRDEDDIMCVVKYTVQIRKHLWL